MPRAPLKPRNRSKVLQGEILPPEKHHGTGHKGFQKGMAKPAGSGRKKGQQNVITTQLKLEIIAAAQEIGIDGQGTEKLRGYLKQLATRFPKTYAHLLARVLPYQVNASVDHEHRVFRSEEEVEAEMRKRGLPIPRHLFN